MHSDKVRQIKFQCFTSLKSDWVIWPPTDIYDIDGDARVSQLDFYYSQHRNVGLFREWFISVEAGGVDETRGLKIL